METYHNNDNNNNKTNPHCNDRKNVRWKKEQINKIELNKRTCIKTTKQIQTGKEGGETQFNTQKI